MNRRLTQLASMIPRVGVGMADVGTDHGLIPVHLARSGYPGRLFATDIAEAPLRGAVALAEKHRVRGQITFAVSDGLDFCRPDWVDCILIAGMGGDTICRILDRAEWIMEGEYTLVLQPMTHPEVLRYWLMHNEFPIVEEAVVEEEGHVYQMFRAAPGQNRSLSDAEYCAGARSAVHSGDPAVLAALDVLRKREKKLRGLRDAGQADSAAFRFTAGIVRELRDLCRESSGFGASDRPGDFDCSASGDFDYSASGDFDCSASGDFDCPASGNSN